jgi:prolyl oligopeptidase
MVRRVIFAITQWNRARRYLAAEAGETRELGIEAATWRGASDYEAISEEAVSADGTRVPMTFILRRGLERDGRRPTYLVGYGSLWLTDDAVLRRAPLRVALAGWPSFAECGVRGGGGKGRAWHEAGRAANKPNGARRITSLAPSG